MTFFKGPCILAGSHVSIPMSLTEVKTTLGSVDVGQWLSTANRRWEEVWILFHSREVTHFQSKKMEIFINNLYLTYPYKIGPKEFQ